MADGGSHHKQRPGWLALTRSLYRHLYTPPYETITRQRVPRQNSLMRPTTSASRVNFVETLFTFSASISDTFWPEFSAWDQPCRCKMGLWTGPRSTGALCRCLNNGLSNPPAVGSSQLTQPHLGRPIHFRFWTLIFYVVLFICWCTNHTWKRLKVDLSDWITMSGEGAEIICPCYTLDWIPEYTKCGVLRHSRGLVPRGQQPVAALIFKILLPPCPAHIIWGFCSLCVLHILYEDSSPSVFCTYYMRVLLPLCSAHIIWGFCSLCVHAHIIWGFCSLCVLHILYEGSAAVVFVVHYQT